MTEDPPSPGPGLGDDRGVSIVLGAMLLAGIALIAVASYETQVTPDLQAKAEQRHLEDVTRELSTLAAEMSRHAANRSSDVSAHPVPLGYEAPSLFGGTPVSGSLVFDPLEDGVRLDAHRLVVQRQNGSTQITQPENWHQVNGTETIDGIQDVANLRVKLDEIAREMTGDHVVVEAEDGQGDPAGTFRLCIAKHSPDWDLHYLVTNPDGSVLYNNADSYFQNQVYDPFWVNLLNPDYRFDELLEAADTPVSLTLRTEDDIGSQGGCPGDTDPGTGTRELSTEFAITYREATPTGEIVKGGGGLEREDVNRTYTSGRLTFEPTSQIQARGIVLAHGAVVRDQAEGAVFRMSQRFDAGLAGNTVTLEMALPRLAGTPGSTTGTSTAVVDAVPGTRNGFEGQASNLTVNLTTNHPDLWVAAWTDELEAAGLSGDTFDVATGPNWARLDVWGLVDPDPGSEQLDLFVQVQTLAVEVDVEG